MSGWVQAARVVEQHRSSQRYDPVPPDFEVRLVKAMKQVADQHPRWGYRRVHAVLVSDGWDVNVKRIERLWREHQLKVPPRRSKASGQRALGNDANALWSLSAGRPGHIWTYDFMSVRTSKGTKLRVLNVLDEFTRVCVGFHVGYSIGAESVKHELSRLFEGPDTGKNTRTVRLQFYKLYNFGSLPGEKERRDIDLPGIGFDFKQQDLKVLHTYGFARDFEVTGELVATLSGPARTQTIRDGKAGDRR